MAVKEETKEKEETSQTSSETKEEFVQLSKSEYDAWKKEREEDKKFREETTEYLKGATVVVETLASDPSLTAAFRAKLEGKGTGEQPQEEPEEKETPDDGKKTPSPADRKIDEVALSQRESIVTSFEKEVGITALPEEERKEAKRKIESYLNDFGWSVRTMPLTQLRSSLDKAYLGTHAEKLREEGKLEGFVQARTNDQGVMGTIPGTAPASQGQTADLTPRQKEWTEKLGVDTEDAKKKYLEREGEETRLSKTEQKIKEEKKA